jgi:hypothetical protein
MDSLPGLKRAKLPDRIPRHLSRPEMRLGHFKNAPKSDEQDCSEGPADQTRYYKHEPIYVASCQKRTCKSTEPHHQHFAYNSASIQKL